MQKWLETNINAICRGVFNLSSPNPNTTVSFDQALLVVCTWPSARLSRCSYNKYGLIKLDGITMWSYDYGSFCNMRSHVYHIDDLK